jgi:hypothetical protein
MFLDQPEIDFTLEQWQDCRDFYLRASQEPGMEDELMFSCRGRARFASENIRRTVREIDELNDQFYSPAFMGSR